MILKVNPVTLTLIICGKAATTPLLNPLNLLNLMNPHTEGVSNGAAG